MAPIPSLSIRIVFLAALLAIIEVADAAKTRNTIIFQLHSMDPCKGNPKTLVNLTRYTINRARNGATYMDGEIVNSKLSRSLSKMEIKMTACADAVSFNTCEYTGKWTYTLGLCQLMLAQNMPWAPFFNSIEPALGCPLQAGKYNMVNGTMNMDSLGSLGASDKGIRDSMRGKIFLNELKIFNDQRELLFCADIKCSFPISRA